MTDRIKEIEAEIGRYGALHKSPTADALFLLDEVKRLNEKYLESDSFTETYIDALKQRDEKIKKLEAVRDAAKGVLESIKVMRGDFTEGSPKMLTDMFKGFFQGDDKRLEEALAACEEGE